MNINRFLESLKEADRNIGYRYAVDPFLLCGFASVGGSDKVVDLGTASGIIPVLLSATTNAKKIFGLEIQRSLAETAEKLISENGLNEIIEIINTDIREIHQNKKLQKHAFDVVVSNPPYRKPGTGKISSISERAICRHEIFGGLADFLDAASFLLQNKGRVCLIYLPERLPELLSLMIQKKLEPKRLRFVHSRYNMPAKMVLVEGVKNANAGVEIESPLFIYEDNFYSEEIQEMPAFKLFASEEL